ncbi:MAG: PAS domain S-box protein, partial [Deltaproteobacteria bacterium]|nr:PAS domain S-box protein [Deltaproteobacteria bacterium]
MNELSISRLRQMSKEELLEQVFSLALENKTLASRLALKEDEMGADSGVTQSLSGYDEEHKRLLDKLSSLVFTCNARGEISYVNQACLDFIGYSKLELLGENILKVIHEESRQLAMTRIMARFQYDPAEVNEYKIKKKDGSTIWVEIFGVTVEGASEAEEPFLLVNAIDVSKRVAADQALRKNESLFRGFADNLQAAIYMLNDKGEIIYANPFASKISGYSNKELLGLPGFATVHPDDREQAMARNQARLAGENVPDQYDLKLKVKNDEVKWVELHMERFELDGRIVTLGTAIDITARKESERALRFSEEKFKAVAENLQVMIYTYDDKGRFTYANRMSEEMSGYSRSELLQMNVLDLLREDYREIALKKAAYRRQGLGDTITYDVVGVTKEGRERWWELSGVRLKENDSDSPIVLGNAVDITDRIESEAALKASEAKFRNLFEHSTDPMLLLDGNGFFDCNLAAVKGMKANCKADVMIHPSLISPELQPDGNSSKLRAELEIKKAYAKGANRFEWQHRDFNGELFWADVSLTVIPFKNRKILFTVWRNISDIKKLEQLLRDEREQLLVTLRSIGDAVITTD